jgi:pyruvate/2-oxoglutarate dehydrogenase complex dihydrolipoamide acyltransferase (E2) component
MSDSPSRRDPEAGFAIEPRNKFFEANSSIVEHEVRPGRTISFLGEVDLSEIEKLRTHAPPIRQPSYTAFVVKAVALALREFPSANRRVYDSGFWPFGGPRLQNFTRRDVAVAIEREIPGAEGTAFIDILRDADTAPLDEITTALKALGKADVSKNAHWSELSASISRFPSWISHRLIRRRLSSPEHWVKTRGGAVLVSSPVKDGVDAVLGTWSHPIGVSFGEAKKRPMVVGNVVEPRTTFFLSLNFDRRIMTGSQAARFFHRIVEILEKAGVEMKLHLHEDVPTTREDFPTLDAPVTKH